MLYVRNLMIKTPEKLIRDAFSYHAPVVRVKKIKDYAFVHFQNRDGAMQSLRALNGKNNKVTCNTTLVLFNVTLFKCCLLLVKNSHP